MITTTELLRQALEHHRAGRLDVAEQIYRQVLAAEPRNVDALNLLGVALHHRGQFAQAVEQFQLAIGIDGSQAAFHINLAASYAALDKTEEAIACYRAAIGLRPEQAKTYNDVSVLLARIGRWDEAAEFLRHVLRLQPGYAPAHNNLGNVLEKQGRLREAIARYREALRLQPNLLQACVNLGSALLESGQLDESAQAFEQALALDPTSAAAHSNLGLVYQAQGRSDEARNCQEEALRLDPGLAPAHNALGATLQTQGKLEAAKACYRRALEINPADVDALHNLAMALLQEGQWMAARASFEQILQLQPDNAQAHYWCGAIRLTLGDFAGGWPEYEWRRKTKFSGRSYPEPMWQGDDLRGRRILIHPEWGLGDTLQFIRYVPLVEARGGDVWVIVQPALLPLLQQSGFKQLISTDAPPPCDVQVPILSLPGIFGTTLETIPTAIPYLAAKNELIDSWREKLQRYTGFKIGIHWRGSQASVFDARSIALADFEPLARVPDTTLFSLQRDARPDELAAVRDRFQVIELGDDVDGLQGPFMDTAAIMANLDLVVTNDTAIAHLAGGLGVRTWVALNYAAAWIWLQDRDDSPWYPTVRLFRQARLDDWAEVFERMATELGRGKPTPLPRQRSADQLLRQAEEHVRVGRFAAAEPICRQLLEAEPDNAEAHHQLGLVLANQHRPDEAIASFRLALGIRADFVEAEYHLGTLLKLRGQLPEAQRALEHVVAVRPGFAEAHYRLADVQYAQGQRDEAIGALQAAVRENPQFIEAQNYLGGALRDAGRLDEAIEAYQQALAIDPRCAEVHRNLGLVYQDQWRTAEAVACQREAVRLRPDFVAAHSALGASLCAQGKLAEAKDCLQRALAIQPTDIGALHELGIVLFEEGQSAAALEKFDQILQLDPGNAQAHGWRGAIQLSLGDFAGGWGEFDEWRRKAKPESRPHPEPLWRGEDLQGRRILIHPEFGLGDTLQLIRYVPLIAARGGDVWVAVQPPLMPLLEQSGFKQLVSTEASPPVVDLHVRIFSLPGIFRTAFETIPTSVPYLAARGELVALWRDRLRAYRGLKIGIHWRGSPASVAGRRSIPLAEFEPLSRVPGTTLFSLQSDVQPDERAAYFQRFRIVELGDEVDRIHGPFMDTAAIMANLDLVITDDTSLAHLAGGMGVPVWLALKRRAAWIWLQDREDSPWYPTMRLFRQTRLDDWSDVFERMATQLAAVVATSSR